MPTNRMLFYSQKDFILQCSTLISNQNHRCENYLASSCLSSLKQVILIQFNYYLCQNSIFLILLQKTVRAELNALQHEETSH